MGANSEDEEDEEDEDKASDNEISEQQANGEATNLEDEASDSDSVASYQPHPDDLVSDSDQDQESYPEEDAEETARKEAYFAPPTDNLPASTQGGFDTMSLTRPILKALAALPFRGKT